MKKICCLILFSLLVITKFGPTRLLHHKKLVQITHKKNLEINDSNLIQVCKMQGVVEPEIVLAQAKLETGNYTSDVFIENNNLFGLYDSNNNEYYKFNSWEESVKAYKDLVQSKLQKNEDYYQFLVRIGYAEDPKYIKKVKSMYSK